MSKLCETNKEKDEYIGKMLGINKWYKWKIRLGRRIYNVGMIMLIWCILFGISAMGYRTFWVSVLSVAIVELACATISHVYYSIKIKIRRRRKSQ